MTPSRILFFTLLVVAGLVCFKLSAWQFARLEQRRGRVDSIRRLREAPALDVKDLRAGAPRALVGRRVGATGRFDLPRSVVLRGRFWEGEPGVEVVTPLEIQGEPLAVLVNRGWLSATDGENAHVEAYPETGLVRLTGLLELPDRAAGGGAPLPMSKNPKWTTFSGLDLEALRGRLPYPLAPFVLRRLTDSTTPPYPSRVDEKLNRDGPHLSYALQWILFGIAFLAGAGMLAARKS
jgi:cytochrome oxidase assembly protein ShyY1